MAVSNGSIVHATARGKEARFQHNDERLLIQYHDHEETIEDRSIIAVISKREPDRGDGDDDKTVTIMLLRAKGPSVDECFFGSIDATGLPDTFLKTHPIIKLPLHLQISDKGDPNIHVVISIRSGLCLAEAFFDNAIRPLLAKLGLRDAYQIHKTASEKSITELAESIFLPKARSGVPQTIILLSGDGAVVDLVNVFHPAHLTDDEECRFVKPTIGLIPMGTGNALANSTGINSDLTHGLRHLLRGSPRSLPTFKANFSPGSELLVDEGSKTEPLPRESDSGHPTLHGAVVLSWGLHASLVADSDTATYRKHGPHRFAMAAQALLSPSDGSPSHVYMGKVTPITTDSDEPSPSNSPNVGGEEVTGVMQVENNREHMYVLATMVSNLQQKLRLSPLSKPLDGQMRLLHFGPMSGERVMRVMELASKTHTHTTEPGITYIPISGLRIDFEEAEARWRRVCVDGKIVVVGEAGWVDVHVQRDEGDGGGRVEVVI